MGLPLEQQKQQVVPHNARNLTSLNRALVLTTGLDVDAFEQVRSFSVLAMLPVWAIRVRACAMLGLDFSGLSLT